MLRDTMSIFPQPKDTAGEVRHFTRRHRRGGVKRMTDAFPSEPTFLVRGARSGYQGRRY